MATNSLTEKQEQKQNSLAVHNNIDNSKRSLQNRGVSALCRHGLLNPEELMAVQQGQQRMFR